MLSQPVRSVVIFCNLCHIPFDFIEVWPWKGEHLTDSFLKINPEQRVPALAHGDYTLWESAAIITYIADAFSTDNQWYPKDLKIRGRINAYLHWHHSGCREPVRGHAYALFMGPVMYGKPRLTEEEMVPIRTAFHQFFENLKWMISETGYVARTAEASIADIFAYSEITMNILVGFDIGEVSSEVQEWYRKIREIPEVQSGHEPLRKYAEEIRSSMD